MADLTPSVPIQPATGKPFVFAIYIGEKSRTIKFSDIPIISDEIDFQFIVAFARDFDIHDQRTNGLFQPYWDKGHFSRPNIEDIRAKHHRVKVLFSIGASDATFPFSPVSEETWGGNALKSLVGQDDSISETFGFDGIDIHYNGIATTIDVFVNTVGHLIRSIKAIKGSDFIVSISPSPELDQYYLPLYQNYKQHIDFVNYQFYAESDPIKSVKDFKSIYINKIDVNNYYDAKLLAGFSTATSDSGTLKKEVFFQASRDLKSDNLLAGIFIWSADNSESDQKNFNNEEEAQDILDSSSKN
ncbi:chitinase 2-like [Quillaja saponaria]|uniref:Chitinase 2-like n=1 Tax=Quillaja saponaria TaxID=32244 RepID=A0AAD7M6A6_QUISA|nr:chitinase 2-like [Quillaja saponaria]